jgi:RimJ/RimL family protein N-acetyltransferase
VSGSISGGNLLEAVQTKDSVDNYAVSVENGLRGRKVELTACTPDCYEDLYRIAVDPDIAFRWRFRGSIPTPEQFIANLHGKSLIQFAVRSLSDAQLIGHVVAFAHDARHSTCEVAAMMTPETRGSGLGIEAHILFLDYLFSRWPLELITAEMPEFNYEQVKAGDGKLFEAVARIAGYRYFNGEYHDLVILTVRRADWCINPLRRFARVL